MEDKIKNLISEFFNKLNLSVDEIQIKLEEESGFYWCSIKTKESKLAIGKNGENLKAINGIINQMSEKTFDGEMIPRLRVDINDYSKKRVDQIKGIAYMMAERARYFKSKVELEPMNSFERRVVHEYISQFPDLESESSGVGFKRHVVISFVKE